MDDLNAGADAGANAGEANEHNSDAGAAAAGNAGQGSDGLDTGATSASWPERGFPDDWKGRLTDGLNAEQKTRAEKYLANRASLADVFKGALSADSKISELASRVKIPTGKNDDPKEVEAFRKALGIPEAHDKYDVWTPEGQQRNEFESEAIGEFLKDAHSQNMSQRQVDVALKALNRANEMASREMSQKAAKAAEAAQEDLRVEYGRDYKPNVELANRYLKESLGPYMPEGTEVKDILSRRFADGTALGEEPGFVKWIISQAKSWADDGAVETGSSDAAPDLDGRINEIMKLNNPKDRAKYIAAQGELERLVGLQQRRGSAKGR